MSKKGKVIYIITGTIIFTASIVLLPLPWWHKILIWWGVGMVACMNYLAS